MLAKGKCPRNFMRAYLANVKVILQGPPTKSREVLQDKKEYYYRNWKNIPL